MRIRHALLALAPASLLACAGTEPPPVAPAVFLPPPVLAAPPPAPTLLVVPRAEASPRRAPAAPGEPRVERLRSDGMRHALERTRDGVLVLSEERGVIGFLRSPVPDKPIRWAGFVEDDTVLVLADGRLFRASSPDEAIAGHLAAGPALPAEVTQIASAGKLVVAAVPAAGGAFQVSTDGGRTFGAAPRPAKGALVDVAVRADGFAAVAFEVSAGKAEVFAGRRAKGWAKGPVAEVSDGEVFAQHGDSITARVAGKKGGDDGARLGLDGKGRWAKAEYPDTWLGGTWAGAHPGLAVPHPRPGLPSAKSDGGGGLGLLGGLMGGGGEPCRGVACLGERTPAGGSPRVRVYGDGECAREHVQRRTETFPVFHDVNGPPRDEQIVTESCDPSAPARRPSTLIVGAGEAAPLVKLPGWCASGEIVGTDRAAFVRCDGKHQGRAGLLHVAASGAFAEMGAAIPEGAQVLGAESASDGTTLLFADRRAWVCRLDTPGCAALSAERFLAARPLPGGRALVARSGKPDELILELFGEPGAGTLTVRPTGDVRDLEVTAEGHVRLWQSDPAAPKPRGKKKPPRAAFLVQTDGVLVLEPGVVEG